MRLGGLTSTGARERERDIDIAPLIDIVFILLIFFMVTTTFARDREIELQRPSAQSGAVAGNRALRVTVDRAGRVRVDGERINPWVLQARLRTLLGQRPSRHVLVVADRGLDTGDLVRVVDDCRLAGAGDVAVAVEEE